MKYMTNGGIDMDRITTFDELEDWFMEHGMVFPPNFTITLTLTEEEHKKFLDNYSKYSKQIPKKRVNSTGGWVNLEILPAPTLGF